MQVAPRAVTFDRGAERIVGLRLAPKGLYRWYASCCKTPLGNTLKPSLPFIGIGREVLCGTPDAASRDAAFGRVRGATFGQHATGGAPEGSTKFQLGLIAHVLRLMLGWKLRGKAWPHPFFDRATQAPSHPVTILSPEEREALRAKCGPSPSVVVGAPRAPSGAAER